jgi:ATP synthase protein I
LSRERRPDLRVAVERDARRHARREGASRSFWAALSLLGTVGWSIVLPTAGGALLGRLLDQRLESGSALTVLLVFCGAVLGGALAWHAVRRAQRGA